MASSALAELSDGLSTEAGHSCRTCGKGAPRRHHRSRETSWLAAISGMTTSGSWTSTLSWSESHRSISDCEQNTQPGAFKFANECLRMQCTTLPTNSVLRYLFLQRETVPPLLQPLRSTRLGRRCKSAHRNRRRNAPSRQDLLSARRACRIRPRYSAPRPRTAHKPFLSRGCPTIAFHTQRQRNPQPATTQHTT